MIKKNCDCQKKNQRKKKGGKGKKKEKRQKNNFDFLPINSFLTNFSLENTLETSNKPQ
jgi:hypothetical protein